MKAFFWMVGIIFGIFLLVVFITNPPSTRGGATKQEVVQSYLAAIQKKDVDGIIALTPPRYKSQEVAQMKIEAYGGQVIRDLKIEYLPEMVRGGERVSIKGIITSVQGKDTELADELFLEYIDNHWYLILGTQNNLQNMDQLDITPFNTPPPAIVPPQGELIR